MGMQMLIFVESYFGDRLISGNKCSEKELRHKFNETLKTANLSNFVEVFCRLYQFEEYPLSNDTEPDLVIDLDTFSVYTPRYGNNNKK